MEIWRAIPGRPGYQVSDAGRVISHRRRRARLLRQAVSSSGYRIVCLGRGVVAQVHQLVLLAFIGPAPDGSETLHRNGNKHDNRLSNLHYGSRGENVADQYRHGRHSPVLERIDEVRRLRASGRSVASIAAELGVNPRSIRRGLTK